MDPLPPLVLEGRHVRLEPLALAHVGALAAVGLDPAIWKWNPRPVGSLAEMRDYVQGALDEQRHGVSLPFATVDRAGDRVVGSTRYGNVDLANRRVEIGWTWLAPAWQRTALNTEAKLLLLRHAFETLGCVRVELKTDALNARSRAAIARIGATEEGILRMHMLTASGRWRDTVYFSLLDAEWPAAKAALEERLARA
ncbi:MAG TPA: GNAT family protein [Planctomycetota bacterium]